MARFFVLWCRNSAAPWPTDPVAYSKLVEKMWAGIDDLMKKGEVKEFGYFVDGKSGYAIGEGDAVGTFRDVSMFSPYYEFDVHEIIPYEEGKETLRTLLKAQTAAAHKGA